jgi:hypothetical protein
MMLAAASAVAIDITASTTSALTMDGSPATSSQVGSNNAVYVCRLRRSCRQLPTFAQLEGRGQATERKFKVETLVQQRLIWDMAPLLPDQNATITPRAPPWLSGRSSRPDDEKTYGDLKAREERPATSRPSNRRMSTAARTR